MTNDKPDLIADPMRANVKWFNDLFEWKGIKSRVRDMDFVGIGTGQIGTNIRYSFDYEINEGGAPVSLVGKFPSDNDKSRATGKLLGHYEREVRFYETFPEVASRIAPDTFYTDYDPATDNFALIMEDMAPSVQGDQLEGCSVEHAERVMDYAAILHASHWNEESLETCPWLQESASAPESLVGLDMITGFWQGFKERYADQITGEQIDIGDAFTGAMESWTQGYEGPRCLTHADFRLDNMLFGASDAGKPLAIVDWQTAGVRGPAIDVAYFIGAGLTQVDRPVHERTLVERYFAALTKEGVTDYSFEDLWDDYRRYSFYGISVAFGAAMLVERTQRGDEMFLTMLRRHCAQVTDLDAVSLL